MSSTIAPKGLNIRKSESDQPAKHQILDKDGKGRVVAKGNDNRISLTQRATAAPVARPRKVAIRKNSVTEAPAAAFTVYVDPESRENNVIYQLEKKQKEEEEAKAKAEKNDIPIPAPAQRRPFTVLETNRYNESDDDDLFSVTSRAPSGATDVRCELSNLEMEDDKDSQSNYQSAVGDDESTEYMTAIDDSQNGMDSVDRTEFDDDFYTYMRQREVQVRSKPNFMLKQNDIGEEMRYVLVDWLVDVVQEYQMQSETLHLACSILDRTLSRFRVERRRLQLVGATAMMIASKYEEIYPPTVKDWVYLTDDTFTVPEFIGMEKAILAELDFVISAPTAHWFGSRFARNQRAERRTRTAMHYLLDLSLLDSKLSAYRPSYIAAACLAYANILTGPVPWSSEMEKLTSIKSASLNRILHELHKLYTEVPKREQHAVFTVYSEMDKLEVATLEAPTVFSL